VTDDAYTYIQTDHDMVTSVAIRGIVFSCAAAAAATTTTTTVITIHYYQHTSIDVIDDNRLTITIKFNKKR